MKRGLANALHREVTLKGIFWEHEYVVVALQTNKRAYYVQ